MREDAAYLRSTRAIRERCGAIFELGAADRLEHFAVDLGRLDDVVERVLALTARSYPDGNIPPHDRWEHFDAGGVARNRALDARLAKLPADEQARARVDLVVVSVLLDAGAGPAWSYEEGESGQRFARSEGLAVASLRMFLDGAFSSERARPLQADAAGLAALSREALERGFQVAPDNPLEGVEGRLSLLRGVARVVPRPGVLFDRLRALDTPLTGDHLLAAVLDLFSTIWPGRIELDGVSLGDVWPHRAVGLVPFHKLSQWLAYSLLRPLERAGVPVSPAGLTGLPEYRNGGLFIDAGVLIPRDPSLLAEPQSPASEAIVEWRALTVALLGRVHDAVCDRLGRRLTLAQVLQGGTWAAGRAIAAEKRPGGAPPIAIISDGTVF